MAAGIVLDKLRGRHKSIRYRFWQLPKRRFRLFLYRLLGRSWIDYYADHIDTSESEVLAAEPVYLDVGKEFLTFLQGHGLRPEHRLLDYGCGILRGGLQFIPYLDPGNYVGVDISRVRLDQGRELMDAAGIARDHYSVLLVQDCSLRELEGQKFEYIWAHAVLTHMPEADIRALLGSLKRHMAEGAQFFFTFFPSDKLGADRPVTDQVRDFYYPVDCLKGLFANEGYDFEVLPRDYRENWGLRTRARLVRPA